MLRLNLSCLVFFLISVLCCPACTAGDTPQLRDEINENNVLKEAVNKDREMINKIVLQNQPPRQPGPAVKDVEFEISGNQIMG
ncbi:MAG: hypothetical protein GX846_05865, partial [Deltaproteobacteria bacterium]|nr:hypothetical protein [Deltaproteobacteria bacterium]